MAIPTVRGIPVWEFLASLEQGTKLVLSTASKIKLAGEERDKASLEETLGKLTSASVSAEEARKEAARKLAARDQLEGEAVRFARDMVVALLAEYGRDTTTLEKFGVVASKPPRQLSAQEKAAAVQKGVATRKARKNLVPRNQVVGVATGDATTVAAHEPQKEVAGTSH